MTVGLGIDTGAMYTNAVLVIYTSDEVLAGARALTTRHNLSVDIGQAVTAVFTRDIWPLLK
jgi:N-methylhydantoinase A/oxoprolinase/acetone carboxylase beta subunit